MTISGERTEQLDIFCRVTGLTSDFLSFIVVELIRFFHRAIHIVSAGWQPIVGTVFYRQGSYRS